MFKLISCDDTKRLLQRHVVILDIRSAEAFANDHIPNATLQARETLEQLTETTGLTTPILVYCNRGNSSKVAAQRLVDCGFKEVYSLEGGFTAWEKMNG